MPTSPTHLRYAARPAASRNLCAPPVVFRSALVLFVAACAAAPTPTAFPTAISTLIPTATPVSQPPDGTYATSITTDEITKSGTSAQFVCENAGTYTMTVAADRWSSIQSASPGCSVANPTDGGTWKFAGNQVTFNEDVSLGCPTVYTYQWSYQGKQISFTLVKDDCTPRVTVMTAHPWVKQE